MPYYLKHYFMPDFNHKRLRPVPMADGNTITHYLGYVQNVVAGQVMAECIYIDAIPTGYCAQGNLPPKKDSGVQNPPTPLGHDYPTRKNNSTSLEEEEQEYWNFLQNLDKMDHRFIYENPVFPMGPNCGRDPNNPNRIIALANGYGFYHDGLITIKKLLNVRQDVNFHTGNITFVGDIVAHGDVYPGFSLAGSSLLIKGRLDGGKVKARGNVVAESGIKGSPDASIRSGLTVRVANCERATIVTPGNLVVDGNVLHSDLFVGGSLIIKGRLQGGNTHVGGLAYIKQQLGNVQGARTRLSLGYNPLDFLDLQEVNSMEREQEQILENLEKMARKGPLFAKEAAPGQELATRKLEVLEQMRNARALKFTKNMKNIRNVRVIIPGMVYPGVEITDRKSTRLNSSH